MPQDLSMEETILLATYANRTDAAVAQARLAERAIDAVIVADDVHPPFQLTEGVELRVLEGTAGRARGVLDEASGAAEVGRGAERPTESADEEHRASLTLGGGGLVQATSWAYVAAFLLMVTIILIGLLVGL